MNLPLTPPIEPMLAKLSRQLPHGELLYEPKWDGFRCLVFRDGDELVLQSRNGKDLLRYFPELADPLRERLPARVVVDGELVIATPHGLDFDAMTDRIHPAASRVELLAERTPASYVAFDLLALGDRDLTGVPNRYRRADLEATLADVTPPVHVTPATLDARVAADWFERFEGAGLDGVIARPLDLEYRPGARALTKVKHLRTADVVVGGYRIHKDGEGVGSLLLGLYDPGGSLHHVGVASSFKAADRRALRTELEPLRAGPDDHHPWVAAAGTDATPRGGSRWNQQRDTSWEPLRLERVAEVAYEGLQGDRFRHAARFVRWRPDRDPASCTYDQLETPIPEELHAVFAAGAG